MEDLFYYNFRQEIYWSKSLNFLINENKYKKSQCSDKDTRERAY